MAAQENATERRFWELSLAVCCLDKLREIYSPEQIAAVLKDQSHSGETLASVYFHAGDGRYLSVQVWAEHDPGCDGFAEDNCYELSELYALYEASLNAVRVH